MVNKENRLAVHDEHGSSLIKCILIYTPIFILVAILSYMLFISNYKTLVRYLSNNRDAFAQRYIFVFEFNRFLKNLFAGYEINTWDWSIGLGADAYSFNSSFLFSPTSYMLFFTPAKYMDIMFSVTIMLRVYLCGITFMLFAKKIGFNEFQIVLGALLYSLCPWIIVTTVYQGSFVKAALMFPLLILGEEKIIRRESPLLFMLSVGYSVLISFAFSYMMAIGVLIYFFVRMITNGEPKTVLGVIKTTALFIFSGITGIMLSGVGLVVTLLKFSETTTTTGKAAEAVWSITECLRLPLRLMTWNTFFGSSSIVGIAAIGIVMVPLIAYKAFKRDTNAVMTVLMFIFVMIPAVNSMFNFFSYPSGRWMFMLMFFFCLSTASCCSKELLESRKSKIAITVVFTLYTLYIAWLQKICDKDVKLMLLFSCIAGYLCIGVIWAFIRKDDDSKFSKYFARTLIVTIMCFSIAFNYNMRFRIEYELFPRIGVPLDLVEKSEQRVGPMIKDDDFWRIDQATIRKVNDQMFYGNRSNYVFYSNIDVGWIEYNKLLGNNQSYYKRVRTKGHDKRFGLDFLTGTKYFIGNHGKRTDRSGYAGYGFEPYKTIDHIDVLKNKYSIGIGCVFDTYMRQREWLKLSYADREMAMLMAVIVPDDRIVPRGMKELKAKDVHTGVKEIPYKIYSNEEKTQFVVTAENDDDHQLLMSLENVQAAGDYLFELDVKNDNVKKVIVNSRGDERGFPDMRDLTVNLGSGEGAGREIEIVLRGDDEAMASGITFDDLKIYSMPHKTYSKYAEILQGRRFVTDRFFNDHITGTVNVEKPGILYFSILDDYGWDVYIDGHKVEPMNKIDVAFMGVEVTPGEHRVELKYHTEGFWPGVVVTLVGLILMMIILRLCRKRPEDEYDEEEEYSDAVEYEEAAGTVE